MADTSLIAFAKASSSSIQNKRGKKSDLRLQLRDEIDRLALYIRELKAQADSVQKAADALGDELLCGNSEGLLKTEVSHRDGDDLR